MKKKKIRNPGTVPFDLNDNQIADHLRNWDKKLDGSTRSGTEDSDHNASHNTTFKGDGLTAYEEYRGFYFKDGNEAEYNRSLPDEKDLFIFDEHNIAKPNISYFLNTNIRPHFIFRRQMNSSRVFNFNRKSNTAGQQHGLIIRNRPAGSLRGRAYGFNHNRAQNTPKFISKIHVNRLKCTVNGVISSTMVKRVVAHETTHACNVVHHGRGNTESTGIRKVTPGVCSRIRYILTGGTHSGVHNCYMKYSIQRKYLCESSAAGNILYPECDRDQSGHPNIGTIRILEIERGVIGSIICSSQTGTGENQNGNCGGNATKGNCVKQLRIKDF